MIQQSKPRFFTPFDYVRHQQLRPLWLLVNGIGLILTARLAWMLWHAPLIRGWILFQDGASENIVQFTGKTGLIFLLLSLACTPFALLGWREAITVRKSLGLWGFGFGAFHGLYFLGGKGIFFKVEAWKSIWQTLTFVFEPDMFAKVPFARYGLFGLLLLTPLVLTSNRWAMRRLGKNWKRLHRLVYAAVPLLVWHYWQRETWESTLGMGRTVDWTQSGIFALLAGMLLVVRLPIVRKWVVDLRLLVHS
ncbi:MAG: ferric reductase-like transmembrane domain-containing protein [Caldilineaceae bacterium]